MAAGCPIGDAANNGVTALAGVLGLVDCKLVTRFPGDLPVIARTASEAVVLPESFLPADLPRQLSILPDGSHAWAADKVSIYDASSNTVYELPLQARKDTGASDTPPTPVCTGAIGNA